MLNDRVEGSNISTRWITSLVGIVLVCVGLALIVPILYDLYSFLDKGLPYSAFRWSSSDKTMIAIGVIAFIVGIVVWFKGSTQSDVRLIRPLQGQLEEPEEEMPVDSENTLDEFAPRDIRCPICGSETAIRTAKQGLNAGIQFNVCTRYPECKGKFIVW